LRGLSEPVVLYADVPKDPRPVANKEFSPKAKLDLDKFRPPDLLPKFFCGNSGMLYPVCQFAILPSPE
jgi:hypothetical protein